MELGDICRLAVRKGASDVHLKVGRPPMLRVDGDLQPLGGVPPLTNKQIGEMAWKVMSEVQRQRFKAQQDLDLSWHLQGVGRFRVNVFRQRNAMGMVLRTIPDKVRTIDELGLPPVLKRVALGPRGLVLVTGATGSGKSTTLAAMVQEVNAHLPHHVLTIEDPIEFAFRDQKAVINQREIGVDSVSFPVALRAALRQDPDVILVGELRDLETVEIALQAAETGHLVLSTLHTLDAVEAINRLIGFFPPHHQKQIRHQLAAVLRAVISQRLVPSLRGGRVAALEVLINTPTISECIADMDRVREIPDHMLQGHKVHGSQTFDQAVFRLCLDGVVDPKVALRYATNPDELALRLRGIGADEWA